MNLHTAAGIGAAVKDLAPLVAFGDLEIPDAVDFLMNAYMTYVWNGNEDRFVRTRERLLSAMEKESSALLSGFEAAELCVSGWTDKMFVERAVFRKSVGVHSFPDYARIRSFPNAD